MRRIGSGVGLAAIAAAMGAAGCGGGGGGGGSVATPPPWGVNYGERLLFRCEYGRGFRVTLDNAKAVARLELDEHTTRELKRVQRSAQREVYTDGRIRLTVAPGNRTTLELGPGNLMTGCEALLSGGN
jgi:hypothetical protein